MSDRLERVLERLPETGVDALLVSDPLNLRYLTGFSGSNGLAVIAPGRAVFLTDFRYTERAAAELDEAFERHTVPGGELLEAVAEFLPEGELALGFDDAHLSVRQHAGLSERLGERVRLLGVCGLVESLRAIKDEAEIAHIAEAAELADAALRRIVGDGLEGRTETDVALALEIDMRRRGATRPSFPVIVAAGANGALPHAAPRDVEIRRGDLVVIDWGAELDGYCSDCTRTFSVGEPAPEARRVYELVLEAQLAGLHAVRAGVDGRDADSAARDLIEAGGHGQHFGHGLGHGVGIEVHEAPRLSQRSSDRLEPGHVVTVEPGIYLPGRFGVRIEDLVAVTANGPRVLTSLSKELTAVE
ncbi:MAG TPA: Xaa-Pro peptidase family protein [Solirubrobacteraceae bacterium]|nr:Xaa-Pro peptidase family protein [Solirubrobacteraceae bacterium]